MSFLGVFHPSCDCSSGFDGDVCEDAVSHTTCATLPCCAAGGSCIALFNGPICNCRAGYSGDSCSHVSLMGQVKMLSEAQCNAPPHVPAVDCSLTCEIRA